MNYSLLLVTLLTTSSLLIANEKITNDDIVNETIILDIPASSNRVDKLDEKVNRIDTSMENRLSSIEIRNENKLNSFENRINQKLNLIETNQKNSIKNIQKERELLLEENKTIIVSVVGQGVAPMNTISPAQAYALAKRAAVGDAYRLIAEKVKGVRVDGQDLIRNMMIKRSTVRTSVNAMVRNAHIVETTFKDGLCEVEMEIEISKSQFPY